MLAVLVKRLIQSLSLAAILTVGYLNVIVVEDNNILFLKDKTQGYLSSPLNAGYHWLSTGFVPAKWTFYKVALHPPAITVKFEKALQYTEYLSLAESFKIKIQLNIKYRLTAKVATQFLKNLSEKPEKWPFIISARIKNQFLLVLDKLYRNKNDLKTLEAKLRNYFSKSPGTTNKNLNFRLDWPKIFGEASIMLNSYELTKINVPDAQLYHEQTRNIQEVFQARRKALLKKIENESSLQYARARGQNELILVQNFSKLLRNNPSTKEVLKYYKLNPHVKVMILNGAASNKQVITREINNMTQTQSKPLKTNSKQGQIAPLSK